MRFREKQHDWGYIDACARSWTLCKNLNDNEKRWFHNNLNQNEAESACAGLAYKGDS